MVQNAEPPHQPETIGKRIARLRAERGWTQQALAYRLAISRVAVSHIEMDLSIPSERTIILLAGLFKTTPHALVEGSTYPQAKAERLPLTVLAYSEIEMELARLAGDLDWINRLADDNAWHSRILEALEAWSAKLERFHSLGLEEAEREQILSARRAIREAYDRLRVNRHFPG